LYYYGTNDNGGVHWNSGVNNKLCYLLTDGDTFRNITVSGMGITLAAALYYEANVNLLTASSGWDDLASALRQAAINNGWSSSQRANLEQGLLAVGIGYLFPQYFVDENITDPCLPAGDPFCSAPFFTGPYHNLNAPFLQHLENKTVALRGTAHVTRVDGVGKIVPWDGPARFQP